MCQLPLKRHLFLLTVTLTSLLSCCQVMVQEDTPALDAVCKLSLLKHYENVCV